MKNNQIGCYLLSTGTNNGLFHNPVCLYLQLKNRQKTRVDAVLENRQLHKIFHFLFHMLKTIVLYIHDIFHAF